MCPVLSLPLPWLIQVSSLPKQHQNPQVQKCSKDFSAEFASDPSSSKFFTTLLKNFHLQVVVTCQNLETTALPYWINMSLASRPTGSAPPALSSRHLYSICITSLVSATSLISLSLPLRQTIAARGRDYFLDKIPKPVSIHVLWVWVFSLSLSACNINWWFWCAGYDFIFYKVKVNMIKVRVALTSWLVFFFSFFALQSCDKTDFSKMKDEKLGECFRWFDLYKKCKIIQ